MGKAIGSLLVAALGIMAMPPETHGAPRDLRMVVRNMTYYLEGSAEANPTLRLHAGETIRLIVRNEDRGMKHDLTIPDWDAATPLVAGQREGSVLITAPSRGARADYHCTPHAETMRGTIIVE